MVTTLEKAYKDQKGMTVLSTLIIMIMAGLILLCGLRIAPAYIDNSILKEAMESMNENRGLLRMSERDIRRSLSRTLLTNNIRNFDMSKVILVKGQTASYVLINYESRAPLFYNIEAVVIFKNRFDI